MAKGQTLGFSYDLMSIYSKSLHPRSRVQVRHSRVPHLSQQLSRPHVKNYLIFISSFLILKGVKLQVSHIEILYLMVLLCPGI